MVSESCGPQSAASGPTQPSLSAAAEHENWRYPNLPNITDWALDLHCMWHALFQPSTLAVICQFLFLAGA